MPLCFLTFLFQVSIPHRYCKNCTKWRPSSPRSAFQFLIGTVKTFQSYLYAVYENVVSIPHRYCKNVEGIFIRLTPSKVSIPHRYCKNISMNLRTGTITPVSIPHRYCKNTRPAKHARGCLTCFNSS